MRRKTVMKVRLVQPSEDVPILTIRIDDVPRITGWSLPTVYRHLPHLKKYVVTMPGATKGTTLIDYQGLKDYLAKFAEGEGVSV
jgi:hypothetical protein